jgi:glyoxylase-like metal-dependent hydrolase (beta-lactamase superfamily II)
MHISRYKNSFLHSLLAVSILCSVAACSDSNTAGPSPFERAVTAGGGSAALTDLTAISLTSSGERNIFDEGFTPGGDVESAGTFSLDMTFDVAAGNIRLDYLRQSVGAQRVVSEVIVGQVGFIEGQDVNFSPPDTRPMSADRWASTVQLQRLLNPQLVLREVLADPGLIIDNRGNRFRVRDDVNPLTLTIDPTTGFITRLETVELDYNRRDVPLEVSYADWQPFGELFFPTEVSITLAGALIHRETRTAVEVNPVLSGTRFDLPAGITPVQDAALADRGKRTSQYLQSFVALGFIKDGAHTAVDAVQIAPGVFHLTDPSNNSLVIEQANGVVVVEGVLHDLRAGAIIDWITTNLPGKPITHLINTHHHADHAGGTRLFVAQGASVVVHEAAESFYRDMLQRTDTTLLPDALDLNPVAAAFQVVPAGGSLRIDDTLRPVVAFPVVTTHAADMTIIFVENPGVIFVSDIFSPGGAAGAGAVELNTAIVNNGLNNPAFIIAGGHGGTIPYSDFLALLP